MFKLQNFLLIYEPSFFFVGEKGDERTEKTRNHKELKDKRHGTLNLQELNSICNLQPQVLL